MRTPDVLRDPAWLLADFDSDAAQFIFVETTREILVSSPFIDGRTPLSRSGRIVRIDLAEAASLLPDLEAEPAVDRMIAHVGFSGSTLLARTLDATGLCQTFREPQAIIAISTLKSLTHPLAVDPRAWNEIVRLTRTQFRKTFAKKIAVMKPSNWPLNVLPDLIDESTRVVFVTSDPRDYLEAILRGGDDRVRFMLKFVQSLRQSFPQVGEAVGELERGGRKTRCEFVLCTALLALSVQNQMFDRIARRKARDQVLVLSAREFKGNPRRGFAAVLRTMGISAPRSIQSAAIRNTFSFSSKRPWEAFDGSAHAAANERVRSMYAREIELALTWGARCGLSLPGAAA